LNRALKSEIDGIRRMTVAQLQQKHLEVFGDEARSKRKEALFKRIAWRLQTFAEGGLSERARRWAMELANDEDLRIRLPKDASGDSALNQNGHLATASVGIDARLPMPGTILSRDYKGRRISVEVRENGFAHDGKLHRSLSAVAQTVTGTKWNGFLFWGLTQSKEAAFAQQ
jgi:Protein of unknown function (DUF2924)